MVGCPLKNVIHSGHGGLAQSTFGAGRLPQEEVEEAVMSDENHLGLGNVTGEFLAPGCIPFLVFSSSEAITGNNVFKNKVIPGRATPGHSMQTVPIG